MAEFLEMTYRTFKATLEVAQSTQEAAELESSKLVAPELFAHIAEYLETVVGRARPGTLSSRDQQ